MNKTSPLLVADIGGTNSRFGIAYISDDLNIRLENIIVMSTDGYAHIEEAIFDYLDQISVRPNKAVIAAAGPVLNDKVALSNGRWNFRQSDLIQRLKMDEVKFLNDFAANACALPLLKKNQIAQIGSGVEDMSGTKVVVGPGTGTGVAALVCVGEKWKIIPSEGGNVGFSPKSALESELFKIISDNYKSVTSEKMIAGPGISNIYHALGIMNGKNHSKLSPEQITNRAIHENDEVCIETIQIFCGMLGSFSSDLALMFNATGGIYLAGGVLPKINDIFVKSNFRERFEDHEFLDFVKDIPTYNITEEQPALIGAAGYFSGQFL